MTRLRPADARALQVAALALPALAALAFVALYGTAVPKGDVWDYLPLLDAADRGQLTLRALLVPHNEHVLLVPQLVMLGLDSLTGFDLRAELYLSWACLAVIAALLYQDFRRVRPDAPWLFLPCAALVFTVRQLENLVDGFQVQITLATALAVGALALLGDGRIGPARLAGSVACGLAACLSFGSGVLVWPAGVLHLVAHGRRRGQQPRVAIAALAAAGALSVLFLSSVYHPPSAHPPLLSALRSPFTAAQYFLSALGSPLAWDFPTAVWTGALFAAVGAVIVPASLRLASPRALLAPALIAFTLGNTALLTLARAGFGADQSLATRYVTLTAPGLCGLWILLLDAVPDAPRRSPAAGMLLALWLVGTGVSFQRGFTFGRASRFEHLGIALLLYDLDKATDAQLLNVYPAPAVVRQWTPWLRRHRRAIFRDEP